MLILSVALLLTAHADRPVPTKDAAAKMTVPAGFKVTLFAGEPDIVQPIAFTFDDRGRMWVVECLSYPKWSKDGTGKDRVVILEDTDGDGVHDKKTVFLDNGSNLSGIELGFGGVWLCSSPNLVFIPAQDDKPAGPPRVVLDGWNMTDTKHNIFNSLGWGPDGYLYGCNGIQAKAWVGTPGTPKEKRTYLDCGVWRYHPTRKVFEAVAHGTTNPFGLDWDEYGEMFITNCVIDHLFHIVPGGHYERMYGQDANPHAYGLMKSCVDYKHWAGGDWTTSRTTGVGGKPEHSDAGGGHAHSGCAIYLADNFPKEYRNTLFTANIHGNRLNNDGLARTPSGMKGVRRPDFLFANDSWFRGICVKVGPDGGLYVSDWCDTGECHNYDVADTTNGRIYRVVYGNQKGWSGDVSKLTDAELAKMATSHPNEWFVRKARRVLQERTAGGKLDVKWFTSPTRLMDMGAKKMETGKFDDEFAEAIFSSPEVGNPRVRLRALWLIRTLVGSSPAGDGKPEVPDPLLPDLRNLYLYDQDESVRLNCVRWAVERFHGSAPAMAWLLRHLSDRKESSLAVWAAAAPALCWLPKGEIKLPVRVEPKTVLGKNLAPLGVIAVRPFPSADFAAALLGREDVARAPELSKLVWYSAAAWLARDQEAAVTPLLASNSPLIRQNLCRFLLAQPDRDVNLARLVAELGGNRPAAVQADILSVLRETLAGTKAAAVPKTWPEVYAKLLREGTPAIKRNAEAVAVMLGDPDAIASLQKRITDVTATADDRSAAIELLLTRKQPEFAKTLRGLLDDPAVRQAAVRGLAAFADADTPAAILKAYPRFTPAEKLDAVNTLAARAAWAKMLLDAVEKKELPRADIPVATARQIIALNDKAVSSRLETVWGKVGAASKERVALTKKWKETLTEPAIAKANPARGRMVFAKHCAACHKMFGEGQTVGPELTGSQRANLDYVLENVLDPSAVVPREFQMVNFTTTDERVVSGIVLRETKDAVTVRTPTDTVVLPTGDVAARKQTNVSIMPDGLFDQMKPDEVRDLVAYLRAKEQVPIPK